MLLVLYRSCCLIIIETNFVHLFNAVGQFLIINLSGTRDSLIIIIFLWGIVTFIGLVSDQGHQHPFFGWVEVSTGVADLDFRRFLGLGVWFLVEDLIITKCTLLLYDTRILLVNHLVLVLTLLNFSFEDTVNLPLNFQVLVRLLDCGRR